MYSFFISGVCVRPCQEVQVGSLLLLLLGKSTETRQDR